jgi:carbonic anhydrase/acetyltransferase-like protein (isoleucine patch superfamily)
MAVYQFEEHAPQLGADVWVAESAALIGRVALGDRSSVWYGALLRGDNDWIRIGERCNIQDGAVLHTDAGIELVLEREVSVGHQAMLHGCHVGEGSLIGIQAVVLNGARIGRRCVVGAGAVVTEGKAFPDLSLIVGAPARVVRSFTPEDFARFALTAPRYVELARRHRDGVRRIA